MASPWRRAPPKVRFHARTELDIYARKAKAVVIRHRSGHQVIAMIEIVSPGNKSSQTDAAAFVQKAEQALRAGIHLLIVDLFPPNRRAPKGIHRAIWGEESEGDFALPTDKPLTCVSYVGYPCSRGLPRAGRRRRQATGHAPVPHAGCVCAGSSRKDLSLSLGGRPIGLARGSRCVQAAR